MGVLSGSCRMPFATGTRSINTIKNMARLHRTMSKATGTSKHCHAMSQMSTGSNQSERNECATGGSYVV
jgi:hypothetical protein